MVEEQGHIVGRPAEPDGFKATEPVPSEGIYPERIEREQAGFESGKAPEAGRGESSGSTRSGEKPDGQGAAESDKTADLVSSIDESVEQLFQQATGVAEELVEKVEEVAPFTKHGLARLLAPSSDAFNPDRQLTASGKVSRVLEQFVRFCGVSFTAFVMDYAILVVLTSVFGVHYLVSNTISFAVSCLYSYVLSMRYVYVRRPEMEKWRELFRFMILSLIGLGINDVLMWAGTGLLGITYLITKVIAGIVGALWNFWSRKVFIDAS